MVTLTKLFQQLDAAVTVVKDKRAALDAATAQQRAALDAAAAATKAATDDYEAAVQDAQKLRAQVRDALADSLPADTVPGVVVR